MDISAKRNLIENITDEVKKFHPLLENILPKLPNVVGYEYTHGQYERGADFIIEVENSTTKRRSHIGVVVKCGKIGAKEVPNVEDQIKECAESRKYKVINTVQCNEVWVISSAGYTERATEKLKERCAGRSIEFFGAEDLSEWIDNHYSYFWSDLPPKIGAYLQQLSTRLVALDQSLALGGNTSDNLYIELDTYERIKKTYTKSKANKSEFRNVDFFIEASNAKVSLLEAEMGFGKSKLARRFAMSMCNATTYLENSLLPIFITYREFLDKKAGNLSQLINDEIGEAIIPDDEKTKIFIILDGIDECSTSDKSSADLFEDLLEQTKTLNNCSVLITTRPLKSLVDKAALYKETRTFGIRPLSIAKIVRYLQQSCAAVNLPARLFEDLKKSPLFKQLPHSPIAAALFSNLLNHSQQDVPQGLTELYAKSVELMLGRWDHMKGIGNEKLYKTVQLIAENLAVYFVENKLIYVSKAEISGMISQYISKRNVGLTSAAVENILFERSNIFSYDADSQTVSFRHRSLSEFLCAQKKARDRSISVKDSALDPYWSNVFFFYTGTLLDCPDVFSELRQLTAQSEQEQWMKTISVPNYLLAAHQTEFDEVEKNLFVVIADTAKLYKQIRAGQTTTKLGELSEMHLLYIFKTLIRESLGYDYFSLAFEFLSLKINDEIQDENEKFYALFFLGCAELLCGKNYSFKLLIDEYGASKLPLGLALAVKCEMDGHNNLSKSPLLKHHGDKLKKLFHIGGKASAGQQVALTKRIDEIFTKPVNKRNEAAAGIKMLSAH